MKPHRVAWPASPVIALVVALGCAVDHPLPVALPSADEPSAEAVFSPGSMNTSLDFATSVILESPDGATRIGMLVDLRSAEAIDRLSTTIEVRGFEINGTPTEWLPADVTWSEENFLVARADVGKEIFGAQMRLPSSHLPDITNVTFAAVVPAGEYEQIQSNKPQYGSVESSLTIPNFVKTRAEWGARKSNCSGWNTTKYRMAIHHTFTPPKSSGSFSARIRGIQAYHMDTRGWCDIGYHFLVTDDGQVYEGRPLHFNGAHVGGHNSGNIGISFVGCYETGACDSMGTMYPSNASLRSTGELMHSMAEDFEIRIDTSTVKGHGQHSGAYTACPGDRILKSMDTLFAIATGNSPDVAEPPSSEQTGRAVGVVWDSSITNGPADPGALRLPAANVAANGQTIGAKGTSAYWELILPVGTHTLTATAPGYGAAARTIDIKPGQETWASLGLTPDTTVRDASQDGTVAVQVIDANGQSIPASAVQIQGELAQISNASGTSTFPLQGGDKVTFTAYGANMQARTVTHQVNGDALVQIALEPEVQESWTGTIQGVIWDESVTTSPSAEGNVRLGDALVLCDCGKARTVRSTDAFWSFELPGGSYTFTALAAGYTPDSKQVSISWGGTEWGSIGLTPQ